LSRHQPPDVKSRHVLTPYSQISIIIFATIVIASDLAWRSASCNQWGGHYVESES
jgi:hypothetical protein